MLIISASPIYASNQRLAVRNYSKLDQTGPHTARDLLSHGNTDVSEQCDTLCITLDVDCLTCLHIIQNRLQALLIYPVMEITFCFLFVFSPVPLKLPLNIVCAHVLSWSHTAYDQPEARG